jgi:hypothetical protein
MTAPVAVSIITDDVAFPIDVYGIRLNRSRYVDGRKCSVAQQKTMIGAVAVNIGSDDVASPVDAKCEGAASGSRWIDGRECAVAQQKTMKAKIRVIIETDDVASRVDRRRTRPKGSREVDLRERLRKARVACDCCAESPTEVGRTGVLWTCPTPGMASLLDDSDACCPAPQTREVVAAKAATLTAICFIKCV